MQNQTSLKEQQILKKCLQKDKAQLNSMKDCISLETLVHYILDQNCILKSDEKSKFLQIFKIKILECLQTQAKQSQSGGQGQHQIQQNKPKIGRSNILCYLSILIERNMIFLCNEEQWKSLIDLLLKIILGKSYSLQTCNAKKYELLMKFLHMVAKPSYKSLDNKNQSSGNLEPSFNKNNINKNNTYKDNENKNLNINKSQITNFVNGLKSLGIFRHLCMTCSSMNNFHLLFEICFIFLCHSYSRKVDQSKQDQKTIQNFLNQFFISDLIKPENLQFYYKILKNYTSYFYKELNRFMLNLFLKTSTQMLVRKLKLTQTSHNNTQTLNVQILDLRKKVDYVINKMNQLYSSKYLLRINEEEQTNIKNFGYLFKANALLKKDFQHSISNRLQIQYSHQILFKMFGALGFAAELSPSIVSIQYTHYVLNYINKGLQKTRIYPQKGLVFNNNQSHLQLRMFADCQLQISLKVAQSRENHVIFQLVTKKQRFLLSQKVIDLQQLKYTFQLMDIKDNRTTIGQNCTIQYTHYQHFKIAIQKQRVRICAVIWKQGGQSGQVRLFQVKSFDTNSSQLYVGSYGKYSKAETKIQQVLNVTSTEQYARKSNPKIKEKVDILKLVTDSFEKSSLSNKNSQLKTYGINSKHTRVVQYPSNFTQFATCYNIKKILVNNLKNTVGNYLQLNDPNKYLKKGQKQQILVIITQLTQLIFKVEQKQSQSLVLNSISGIFLNKFQDKGRMQISKNQLLISTVQILQAIQTDFIANIRRKSDSFMVKFINVIIHCSIKLLVLAIDYISQKIVQNKLLNFKLIFHLLNAIIFQIATLKYDHRILSTQKVFIRQRLEILFNQVRKSRLLQQLNQQQKKQIKKSLIFLISILERYSYQIYKNDKNVELKILRLFIDFAAQLFTLVNFDSELDLFVARQSLDVCMRNIQILKKDIIKEQLDIRKEIRGDSQVVINYSLIPTDEQNQNDSQCQKVYTPRNDQTKPNKPVHGFLKDKLLMSSLYFKLYFSIAKSSEVRSIPKLYHFLEQTIANFQLEITHQPSLFFTQLLETCWRIFLEMLQSGNQQNQNDFYQGGLETAQLLAKFGFDMLSSNFIVNIAKTFTFHIRFLLSPGVGLKLQTSLNKIRGQNELWLQDIFKYTNSKIFSFSQQKRKQIEKCVIILVYRTILSPVALQEFQEDCLLQILNKNSKKQLVGLLIKSRQLSQAKISRAFNESKSKQLLIQFLEGVGVYLSNQQALLTIQKQKGQNELQIQLLNLVKYQNQNLVLSQASIIEIDKVISYLLQYRIKLQNETNLQYDSRYFKCSQVAQLLQQHVAQVIKSFQIYLIPVQQKIKSKDIISYSQNNIKINPYDSNLSSRFTFKKRQIIPQVRIKTQIFERRDLQTSDLNRKNKLNRQNILLDHIQNQQKAIQTIESIIQEVQFTQKNGLKHQQFTDFNESQLELSSNLQYMIDDYCDINGFRPLIKRKQVLGDMPKMNQAITQKQRTQQGKQISNLRQTDTHLRIIENNTKQFARLRILPFLEQPISRKIKEFVINSPRGDIREREIGKYVDAFSVTYITNLRFYQGQLRVYNFHLCQFVQNKDTDETKYRQIQALKSQQRTNNQIKMEPLTFKIKIDKISAYYIKKSYLKVDNSIQLYALNKSHFFVFKNNKYRDSFTKKIYRKAAFIPQNIEIYAKSWQKGMISNYEYLMRLNKFSERSFNDISQYYVFPWTVMEFKSDRITKDFYKNLDNFRDLAKPIGKINQVKFNKIKGQYEHSRKYFDSNRPMFLYGSFYSNPAIVSYYMIRLYPFSAHQFQLQNKKFDHADRLFGSIQKNFEAVYTLTGDFKELIPQFYSNPQFLRNRNRYKFGLTQGKVLIDDVVLPKWVITKTPQQFVFRMRKLLQSELVTQNVHSWIDLTFGICADKLRAEQNDNLYNQNVYGKVITEDSNTLSFCNKYLKQFGQIPRIILQHEHPKTLLKKKNLGRLLKKSKSLTDMLKEQLLKQDIKQYTYDECQKLNEQTTSCHIKLNDKENKGNLKEQKQKSRVQQKQMLLSPRQLKKNQQKKVRTYLLLKQNCLISKNIHGVGYYIFPYDNKDAVQYKNKSQFQDIQFCQVLNIDNSKTLETYLFTVQGKSLACRKFQTNSMIGWKSSLGQKLKIRTKQGIKMIAVLGTYLVLITQLQQIRLYTSQQTQLQNHQEKFKVQTFTLTLVKQVQPQKSQIIFVTTNDHLSIVCTYHKSNNFYIFDAREDLTVQFRARFKLFLLFEQKVKQIITHDMGYVLILTDKNRLVFVNMLGQMILNIMLAFAVQKNQKKKQCIQSICFWSQQSSDIIFSTNKYLIYKVDLFDMAAIREHLKSHQECNFTLPIDQFEIFSQRVEEFVEIYQFTQSKQKQKIIDMKMQRRGRHWKLYCLGQKGNIYVLKNRYFDMTKCMKIVQRQRQD